MMGHEREIAAADSKAPQMALLSAASMAAKMGDLKVAMKVAMRALLKDETMAARREAWRACLVAATRA